MLLAFLLGDIESGTVKGPMLLSAFSEHMLLLFLLSNLMTGVVNLTLNPLSVPDAYARAIVLIYMSFLCLVACMLHKIDMRLGTILNSFILGEQSSNKATAEYKSKIDITEHKPERGVQAS